MSTAHPQPLPVAECDYTREIVKRVRPGDRGYQSVTLRYGTIDLPPIEYAIKPGDILEQWVTGYKRTPGDTHVYSGNIPQWFRLNGIGAPMPIPQVSWPSPDGESESDSDSESESDDDA